MVAINNQSKHWDRTWKDRIKPDRIEMNGGKFTVIMNFIWGKPEYFNAEKLDIGCGPALHSQILAQRIIGWRDTWTGIDLSETAVKFASNAGLNAFFGNFLEYDFTKKYDAFILWDTLEHFENPLKVAEKIHKLSRDGKPYVVGNVPLYLSPTDESVGAVERPIFINIIHQFLSECGCSKVWTRIYGICGLPYMLFEGFDPQKKAKDATICSI